MRFGLAALSLRGLGRTNLVSPDAKRAAGHNEPAAVTNAVEATASEALIDLADGQLQYLKLGFSNGTPLIVVNGGRGLDHASVAPSPVWKKSLARHRPIVLYDQCGTGKSVAKTTAGLHHRCN